jgi:hypothetical protein
MPYNYNRACMISLRSMHHSLPLSMPYLTQNVLKPLTSLPSTRHALTRHFLVQHVFKHSMHIIYAQHEYNICTACIIFAQHAYSLCAACTAPSHTCTHTHSFTGTALDTIHIPHALPHHSLRDQDNSPRLHTHIPSQEQLWS